MAADCLTLSFYERRQASVLRDEMPAFVREEA
jgi:hypothetical protein